MSIIVPPPEVIATLGRQSWSQQRYDFTEESDVTGAVAVNAGGSPPRWRASIASARGMRMAEAGAWQAMVLKLEGRRNHLALYDMLRAAPQGTLRGALSLSASAALGASTLNIAGGLAGGNLLSGGGFEIDTNADGLADGWTVYTSGSVGTVTTAMPSAAGNTGTAGLCQRVQSTALNGAIGLRRTADVPVVAGAEYSWGVAQAATAGTTIVLEIAWYNGGAFISSSIASAVALNGRRSVTGTAPAGATAARLYAYMQSAGGAAAAFLVDEAQFEAGAATAYAGLPTLLPGDLLQVGAGVGTSQLFAVVDAATGTDAGAITCNVRSAARIAFASATAVAWDKPLAYFRAVNAATNWASQPNGPHVEGFDLDLLEDWNP